MPVVEALQPLRGIQMSFNRRKFLAGGLRASTAVLFVNEAAGACVDPDELSASVQGMRESLEYTDSASQASRACGGCSFFKPKKVSDGCGHCEVLGGPVDVKGYCVSWTKRS
jgi:High potential iron-sulfur protein